MGLRNFTTLLALLAGSLHAQVCDLTFTTCPDKVPGSITVPMDVISLDVKIPYCPAVGKLVSSTTPSIMFVIDNSGSMNDPKNPTDPTNARFSVVSKLLDSIYQSNPSTKVGLSIFNSRLSFDYRDNKIFQGLWPDDPTQHDSFVPLMTLDSTFGDGGKRVLDTLKALIKTDAGGNLLYNTKRNMERASSNNSVPFPTPHRNGTDITLGFLGALKAMKSSPSPKESQFIIFLSDGEANVIDNIRKASQDDYLAGTNTPTTFTVFFNPQNSQAPLTAMTTMTNNIKANNYSATNPNSALHNINIAANELQAILQNSILNQILYVPTIGKSVTVGINGGQSLTSTTKPDSTHFLLSSRLNLNAGTTQMTFSYVNTYKDTTLSPPLIKDTTMTYTLTVNRSPAGTIDGTLAKSCREQPSLALFAGGSAITNITTAQTNLEAHLTPPVGSSCTNCSVIVTPSKSLDKETIALTPMGPYLGGPFVRAESTTPVAGDGKLQHLASDSIVLTWVDPTNALNVVRKAYPYQLVPSTLEIYSNGKKIDTITSNTANIEVRLTRAATAPCANCTVQVSSTNGTDKESVPLLASGASFNGTFIQIESITPLAGDGKLQHLSTDSIVVVWTNPDNAQDQVRRSYPFVTIGPSLALFGGGKALDTVTAAYPNLEIRLTLPGGVPCNACVVKVSSTNGTDKESIVLSGTATPYRGNLSRTVSVTPVAGNGKLEHAAKDSIVLSYQNPLNPSQQVRVSYLYVDFANDVIVNENNNLANVDFNLPNPDGRQWIISDAPSLEVQSIINSGSCCRVLTAPAKQGSPDSLSTIGIIVEAAREFMLDMNVYTNFGVFVNHVNFTVPKSQFNKLAKTPGKDTRYLRLLWNGLAKDGSRAGTGVYIFKASVTLLPIPGIVASVSPTNSIHRLGIMRRN